MEGIAIQIAGDVRDDAVIAERAMLGILGVDPQSRPGH